MNTILCEHFTRQNPFILQPIQVSNSCNKPKGGLWLSPVESKYRWWDWCIENMPEWIKGCNFVQISIHKERMLIIDSEEDMENLFPWVPYKYSTGWNQNDIVRIDFEKLVDSGVDSILLTEKGEGETRFTYPKSLYGWDCETILVLNNRAIVEVLEQNLNDRLLPQET